MTNVINFPVLVEKKLPVLHQHNVSPEYLEVMYMYENGYKEVMGLPIFQGKHYLLSIEDFQKKIEYHLFEKVIIEDEYGSTKEEVWNEFIKKDVTFMFREGAFIWTGNEFVWVGELKSTVASTNVRIDKSFRVCFNKVNIFLDEGCECQMESKFKHQDEYGKESNMLVVKVGDEAPFVIPDDLNLITKGYKDLALIG